MNLTNLDLQFRSFVDGLLQNDLSPHEAKKISDAYALVQAISQFRKSKTYYDFQTSAIVTEGERLALWNYFASLSKEQLSDLAIKTIRVIETPQDHFEMEFEGFPMDLNDVVIQYNYELKNSFYSVLANSIKSPETQERIQECLNLLNGIDAYRSCPNEREFLTQNSHYTKDEQAVIVLMWKYFQTLSQEQLSELSILMIEQLTEESITDQQSEKS